MSLDHGVEDDAPPMSTHGGRNEPLRQAPHPADGGHISANERDAKGSASRESDRELHAVVWRLAWPSVVTMLLQTLNSFMDREFVGHLGKDALAAVFVAGMLLFLLFSLGMSISVGATALVARFTGAGNLDEARVAGNQALWIGVYTAALGMTVMIPLSGTLVGLMHLDGSAAELCRHYLAITLLGIPPLYIMLILSGAYRGIGDTVTPLIISVVVNIIHLGGDYVLIFGHFGAVRMGLPGGAIALIVSQAIGAVLYIAMLRKGKLAGLMRVRRRLERDWARRILKIGIPAALQNVSRILSMLGFMGVLARSHEATAAVAALAIGMTSESMAFMPGFGFSVAASTLTGQNLGAKRPDRAERAAWMSLQQGLIVMTLMGVVFFVWAEEFSHLFTHDPEVTRLAVAYLRISAISEPFLALGMILTGALNGAGDTRAPAWAGMITMWGVRLPAAYVAAIMLGGGAVGAWWAMTLSTILNGIASWALFKWGRWKIVRV